MAKERGDSHTNDGIEPGGERVAVKFTDRVTLPYSREAQAVLERLGLLDVEALVEEFGEIRFLPLYQSVTEQDLRVMIEAGRENDPEYESGDFFRWFQLAFPPAADLDLVAERLRRHRLVENAFVMRPIPPPVSPGDDPRTANQGYLDAAPNGINARYAWNFAGGDGAGIGFVDMERGWKLDHEDLAAASIALVSGINKDYVEHGTQVLGQVVMVDNDKGGVGIAPSCTARVISQWRADGSYNTPDTIVDAANNMAYGDVLILEAQEYSPVDRTLYWPVEIMDPTYDAIRLATALGVVVVEAACNKGADLDVYTDPSGKKIFDRSSDDFRDSGAIFVGGATSSAPHGRLALNYGSRVDCYGWGQNVDTASTNSTGTDGTMYTATFSGTSSATPIVGGAAVIVQGLAQASLGHRFSPREVRVLLSTSGTPSADPPIDRIGVMPDLRAIIEGNRLGLAADIYLRDYVGDDGNPTGGTVSMSPDIIVRKLEVPNPQLVFGQGSGTENNAMLSDPVDGLSDYSLYVRILNRGGSPAAAVSVDLYFSPPSTLVSPRLWTHIGRASLASVPAGNVLTVADRVPWPRAAIPGPGHYCFVAIAGSAVDPQPSPATFSTWEHYVTYVKSNNNVAWRNFDVVEFPIGPPAVFEQLFNVVGAFDTNRYFTLESIGRLPAGSRVLLHMPTWLSDNLRLRSTRVVREEHGRASLMALNPHGEQVVGKVLLHKGALAACTLTVEVPEAVPGNYDFAIRQLYEDQELGRLTWRFAARTERQPGPAGPGSKVKPRSRRKKAAAT